MFDCNSYVIKYPMSFVKLSDVNVGDKILVGNNKSEDFYSEVCKIDNIVCDSMVNIKFGNGTIINTSVDFCNKMTKLNLYAPTKKELIFNDNNPIDIDIGWFLGMHTGDGCSTRRNSRTINNSYFKYTLKILGNEKDTIYNYGRIVDSLAGGKCKIYETPNFNNTSKIWSFQKESNSIITIINKYFDGKYGSKTYNCQVYDYVKSNNLWLPYISGLIDSDGTITQHKNISLGLCATDVIEHVCLFLSNSGIKYSHYFRKAPKKTNTDQHFLVINKTEDIYFEIKKYMIHSRKIDSMNVCKSNWIRNNNLIQICPDLYQKLINYKFKTHGYYSTECKKFRSKRTQLKSVENHINETSLEYFHDIGLIDDVDYLYYKRCTPITTITKFFQPTKCIDISTKSGKLYVGNFGFVNVKC